jgi:two-component system sensor histidine kinase/response regulator
MIKILTIDDNKDNLLVLEALLSDAFPGSKILKAASGKEGIRKAGLEHPDVILLDLVMPAMDGFETCSRLKKDDSLKSIPVIILTAAEVESDDRVRALKMGAEAFLSKPVDEAELTAQVSAMLRIKQSETFVREENIRLEYLVEERTKDLQNQLEEKRLTEEELHKSYEDLEISKLATLNLLEDVKSEMENRRKAEEEILNLNKELENKVLERTSQLESANNELESFAYSVSHDLRAPLRAIDGFSKYVLDDYGKDLDANGKRLLSLIRTNTQKMDQLITDILALSRVSRSEHKLSKIDMTKMVISMYSECVNPENRTKLNFIINPLPETLGDATYLKQVWTNLISNAIKFSSKSNKPVIRVGGYTENGYNIYFIKDNGVGFNQEYAHKLYGVFQRLHKAEEFDGTGVGLAIVQRIILRHGGRVWAEGKQGEGATFYFSLPSNTSIEDKSEK